MKPRATFKAVTLISYERLIYLTEENTELIAVH